MSVADIPNLEPVDIAGFKAALGRWASGVTVVTSNTSDGPVGLAASSFSSVSLDPPLVMFCPAKTSRTWQQMQGGTHFGINILSASQAEVCNVFARPGDRFSLVEWAASSQGVPVLAGASAILECTYEAVHDAGDHDIVVGRVQSVGVVEDPSPLLYFRGQYGRFEAS